MDSLSEALTLQARLNASVEEEDYATASELRDRLAMIKVSSSSWPCCTICIIRAPLLVHAQIPCAGAHTPQLRVSVAVLLELTELAKPAERPCLCCNTHSPLPGQTPLTSSCLQRTTH